MARLKYIARWGLMRNSIPENDAEHTLSSHDRSCAGCHQRTFSRS
ncbi:MAG: YfbR-like 5'-deoxynucleotidase [Merdibacter sp.]